MRRTISQKLTESAFPVILLLSMIFMILWYVEYRATEDAQRAQVIHITMQSAVDDSIYPKEDEVVEIDFSSDPRIIEAQALVKKRAFDAAETIYFDILAEAPSAQLHNWLGTLYLKQERYTKAVVSFSNALKVSPSYYRARYNRALAYSALEQRDQAISDYEKVIEDFATHVKSHFNLGLLYYKAGAYDLAIVAFRRTAELSNGAKKIKALYLLANSYRNTKPAELQQAQATYQQVIRLKPNHIGARLALITLKYPTNQKGHLARLDKYKRLLELEPDNVTIHRAIAQSYLALQKKKEALHALNEALLYAPNNMNLRFEVITLLMELHKEEEAFVMLKEMENIAPQNSKIYFLLGRIYYNKGDYEASLHAYDKVLAIKPEGSSQLYNNRGLLYVKLKQYDQAKRAYMEAIKKHSGYYQAYYNLGLLALKEEKLHDALAYFKDAIGLRKGYAQAYYNLGLVYTKLQDNPHAIEAYESLLKLKPDDLRVALNLAVRYSKVGHAQKAEDLYEMILQKDQYYFTAWLNLGLLHYQQKAYQQAKNVLEKAVELEPENQKASRALAKSYSALKQHDAAIEILQKLLEQNPADIKTRLAYARAYYRAKKYQSATLEYQKVLRLDPQNRVALKMIEKIKTKKRGKNERN